MSLEVFDGRDTVCKRSTKGGLAALEALDDVGVSATRFGAVDVDAPGGLELVDRALDGGQ